MAGWHHRLDGCESEWTPGVGDGQGGLACWGSWGRKESDTTEWLNWTERNLKLELATSIPLPHVVLVRVTNHTKLLDMYIGQTPKTKKFCTEGSQNNLEEKMKSTNWNELIKKRRFRLCWSEKSWIQLLRKQIFIKSPFQSGFSVTGIHACTLCQRREISYVQIHLPFLWAETLPSMHLSLFFCAFDTA